MRALACILAAFLAAGGALAQSAQPDSSGARPLSLLDATAMADSAAADSSAVGDGSAVADSLAIPQGAGLFGPWTRSSSFDMNADVTMLSGEMKVDARSNGGDVGTDASYSRHQTEFRRQDRESTRTTLGGGATGDVPQLGRVRFDLRRTTMEDITRSPIRTPQGEPSTLVFLIENESRNAMLSLAGGRDLAGPFGVSWGMRGGYLDSEGSNRSTTQDSDRLERGASTRWSFEQGPAKVSAHIGYLAYDGSNRLRGASGDLSARQDTVGTSVDVDLGGRFKLGVEVERSSFDEHRLDFRRNSTGVVDTLNVSNASKVSEERERSVIDKINLQFNSQLLPILHFNSTVTHSFEDVEFSFSEEGRVKDSRSRVTNTMTLDYLDSGSATLNFNHGNRWFDRRTLSESRFRGKKFSKDFELKLAVNQDLMDALSLRVTLSQNLTQIIPTDEGDNDNSDRFVEVADGQLQAQPFDNLSLTLNGTMRRTDFINLSENLVSENREDRQFDVRGGYTWQMMRRLELEQVYRMQIVFKNFHQTDDKDQFNKSGQLNSTLKWGTPNLNGRGYDATKPSVELRHEMGLDENGRRDVAFDPFEPIYSRSLRRFDHLVRGVVLFPWRGFTASVLSQHGLILESNPSTGVKRDDRDKGKVVYRLSGDRSFRRGLVSVKLDMARVIEYGDLIREEQTRYWEAASTLTVNF